MAFGLMAALLVCSCLASGGQQKPPSKQAAPITAYNYQWTTFQNGSADLSFSVRNNTKSVVKDVKYRLVFLDRNGNPIHYEERAVYQIEPGLAVMETVNIVRAD